MKANFTNLIELVEFFKKEETCVKYLKSILWQNGAFCPHCGGTQIMEYKDFKRNRCKDCKKDFSIKQGTIFQDSNISLKKWFIVMYIFNAHKKGISSCQLAKNIGVSQPTAWFMLQRLRFASKGMFKNEFKGVSEIDEVYLGGSETNKHAKEKAKGIKPKAVVIGIINRDTKQVKAMKIAAAEKEFLLSKINMNVKAKSTIITDTLQAYKGLKETFRESRNVSNQPLKLYNLDIIVAVGYRVNSKKATFFRQWATKVLSQYIKDGYDLRKNYIHKTIKHSEGEYVKTDARVAYKIHTNTIEGFWSLLKRGLNGTYHWVSKKHINFYLAEYSMRYNNRALLDSTKFQDFFSVINGKLSYKQLIA